VRNYKDVCEEMTAYIKKMKDCFGLKKPEGEDEGEPAEPEPVGAVPDLLDDAYVY